MLDLDKLANILPSIFGTDRIELNHKLNRRAFLYTEPILTKHKGSYAECQSCYFYITNDKLCELLDTYTTVYPNSSCDYYIENSIEAVNTRVPLSLLTAEEVRLVHRPVRCGNCIFFEKKSAECHAYETLNKRYPEIFDLDVQVNEFGCCLLNSTNKSKSEY